MSMVRELWSFLKVRKKFWLVPILLVMGLIAALAFVGTHSAVAPFIYTLF